MVSSLVTSAGGARRRALTLLTVLAVASIAGTSMALGRGSPPTVLATHAESAGTVAEPAVRPQPTGTGSPSDWAAVSPPTPASVPVASPVAVAPVDPVTAPSLEPDLVLAGTWTVQYRVGPENGYGVNIDLPLRHLDRQTIRPGRTFDFWKAVGEVSRRAGYRMSGVIVGDHIDPNGAIGGGICTVSSALFNAAARAGLAITARTSHGVYLAKYPLGLDAAVAKDVGWAQTMAFRNDTRQTLLIRTVSAPGIARVDLYAAESLGRTVTFSDPRISHRVKATDRHLRTSALPAGTHQRRRDGSDGMVVVVDRLVADATGRIIHRDRWISRYRPLRGLVLDGIG